jgi:hypothetical protein
MYTGNRVPSGKYRGGVSTTQNRPTTAKAGILKNKGLESLYQSSQNLAPEKSFKQFMKHSNAIHNAMLG